MDYVHSPINTEHALMMPACVAVLYSDCVKWRSRLLCFLITRLAAQRAQYLKEKMEETQHYKRALDAQVGS